MPPQHPSPQNIHAEMRWFINQSHQLPVHPEIQETYSKLVALLDALPTSFSTTTAIRKLMESRDACVRACSQNLLQRVEKPVERATYATSWGLASDAPVATPKAKAKVKRNRRKK
jgi:hypothetical protein